jgi:RNA polymerase sigma-70 factor (ECF subfamily)
MLRRLSVVSESTVARYTELDPDVRLMLAVREDDSAAFERLVSQYQRRLLTVLQHWLGNRDLAEDLVQEVFLRVFRARKNYEPTARFSTWIFTIAHNVARNARRTLARRREVHMQQQTTESQELATLEELAKAASGMMPTRQLDKREMSDVVNMAIGLLNERQRMAVLLCKFEGMSYVDIADTMGMTPSAVKSLLSRARGNLRDALEPYLRRGLPPSAVQGSGNQTGVDQNGGTPGENQE